MKKIVSVFLVLALLLGALATFSACGEDEESKMNGKDTTTETSTETSGETETEPDDTQGEPQETETASGDDFLGSGQPGSDVFGGGQPGSGQPETQKPGSGTDWADRQILTGTVLEDPAIEIPQTIFTILGPGAADNEWACRDLYADESSDDPVQSAVYRRQSLIEARLGIRIKYVGSSRSTITAMVQADVLAGVSSFDLILAPFADCLNMAQNSHILEINEQNFPYLDLSGGSWDRSFLEDTFFGGRNYFAAGDITTTDNDGTWALLFNKTVAEDYDMGATYLYDLVKTGNWTVDELLRLARMYGYSDLNKNGKTDPKDRFAIASSDDMITGLFFSLGGRAIAKNGQNKPVFVLNSPYNYEVFPKVVELFFRGNGNVFSYNDYTDEDPMGYPLSQSMFSEGRALFYSGVMQTALRLRDMQVDFGILPMPKLNADQVNYTTFTVSEALLCVCFEKSLTEERAEIAGFVTQALAELGTKLLQTAYYESAVTSVGLRDEDSFEMLPIIFEGRVCDIGYASNEFFTGFWTDGVMQSVRSGSANTSSIENTWAGRVNNRLNRMIQRLERNTD